MKKSPLNSVPQLLGLLGLQTLANQVSHIQHLQTLVEASLDSTLKNHCQVARFEDNTLTLVTDSSAFASRLRYLQPLLIESLKKCNEFNMIANIRVIISPIPSPKPKPTLDRQITPEAAQSLVDTANSCQSEELKAALLKLASHGQK